MKRSKIIDHLQDLQNKVDGMGFKGQNEYDLQLREEIADWLLSQIATSETNKKQENAFLHFNLNDEVFVKLTQKGIEKYVDKHNSIVPSSINKLTYSEFENRKDNHGYHEFQMWDFIDVFGGLGMDLPEYLLILVAFKKSDILEVNPKNDFQSWLMGQGFYRVSGSSVWFKNGEPVDGKEIHEKFEEYKEFAHLT